MHTFKLFLNLLFPKKCIFCSSLLEHRADVEICRDCYEKIPFFNDDRIWDDVKDSGMEHCSGVFCACEYTGIIKDALTRYKFHNKPSYHRALAGLLADKIKKMTNNTLFDIIISVPLHRERYIVRGYNQSLLISQSLGKCLGIPECSDLLSRVRHTQSQSLIHDKHMRHLNMQGAFEVNNTHRITSKSILLVDDILTTGSTLEECSRLLCESGARSVVAGVIASGRRF